MWELEREGRRGPEGWGWTALHPKHRFKFLTELEVCVRIYFCNSLSKTILTKSLDEDDLSRMFSTSVYIFVIEFQQGPACFTSSQNTNNIMHQSLSTVLADRVQLTAPTLEMAP